MVMQVLRLSGVTLSHCLCGPRPSSWRCGALSRLLTSTWGGGQVGVAQSWRWLRSRCPPPTLGSQLRAMSVPPGGFSLCRPWRARTLEPNGRGHRDARGSAWDPSLPACPSAGTELWKRSDFLIPGFRQGFFSGNETSASLLPFSRLGVCCCRHEGRLGDPMSWRAGSCQNSPPPSPQLTPTSRKAHDLGTAFRPGFDSESYISVSVGSLLLVRTHDDSGKPTLGLTATPERRPGPCPEAPHSLEGGKKDSLE